MDASKLPNRVPEDSVDRYRHVLPGITFTEHNTTPVGQFWSFLVNCQLQTLQLLAVKTVKCLAIWKQLMEMIPFQSYQEHSRIFLVW
ncbi:hypothetical protein TNCT_619191 [Trichonephila clavata]|uniref:Uncharacterized protein n=1 Tax=Trichonephila clavata TaxID=2740835 RepID=A0A8X6HQM6_TRICU|nr:hypothetical protein TNCT_619191 [Trichonephila clavata]